PNEATGNRVPRDRASDKVIAHGRLDPPEVGQVKRPELAQLFAKSGQRLAFGGLRVPHVPDLIEVAGHTHQAPERLDEDPRRSRVRTSNTSPIQGSEVGREVTPARDAIVDGV